MAEDAKDEPRPETPEMPPSSPERLEPAAEEAAVEAEAPTPAQTGHEPELAAAEPVGEGEPHEQAAAETAAEAEKPPSSPGPPEPAAGEAAIEAEAPAPQPETPAAAETGHEPELAAAEPVGEGEPHEQAAAETAAEPETSAVEPAPGESAEPASAAVVPPPPETAPAAAPQAPAPKPRRGAAFGWGLAGALIGAAVGFGGFYRYGPYKALDARVGALEGATSGQVEALRTLEMRLAAVEAKPSPAPVNPAGLDALQARVGKLALDEAALAERLAKVEAAAVAPKSETQAQASEPTAAPAATPSPTPTPNPEAAASPTAATTPGPAPMSSPTPTAAAEEPEKPTPAPTASPTPEASAATPAPDPRVAKLVTDEATLDERLAKLEAALAEPKTPMRAAPSNSAPDNESAAVAVAALVAEERLANGRPYPDEIAALKKLGADAGALAALAPYAENGAPTRTALAAAFAKIAPSLIEPERPPANANVAEKWLGAIDRLVSVRPIGEVKGDDPAALVSQAQGALGRGDLKGALAAYGKLPPRARAAAEGWAKDAEAVEGAKAGAEAILEASLRRLAAARE